MKKIITLLSIISTTFIFAQIPSYVSSNGLVGYWPFNGNATDESVNGNNGAVNGATLTTDRFGNINAAYQLDGINDFIALGNWFNHSTFSISIWIKPDNQTGHAVIIDNNHSGSDNWVCQTITDYATNGYNFLNSSTFFPQTNNWSHIVLTSNGSLIQVFLNNVLVSQTNTTISYVYPSKLNLGYWVVDNARFWKGIMDDVCIWNRALTQEEITGLYYSEITCQSLVINTGVLSFNPPTYSNTATIYPNPANDHITIDCGNLANVSGWIIKISNILGQEVFSGAMNTQQYVVPLNTWTGQGIYFVKIYDASNNLMNTKKIILQ